MFLPWLGLFEQIRLADVFVHYDDVQLPQGRSFMSRVQVKTASGAIWMSAPIDRAASGRFIADSHYVADTAWRQRHLKLLRHAYSRAAHFPEMIALAERIFAFESNNVAAFNANGVEAIARHLGLETRFHTSSALNIPGSSTQRLVDLCAHFGATTYVTGHGALRYLNHEAFEEAGVRVEYMDYACPVFPQLHGDFTPYVTTLDPIANCGPAAGDLVRSGAVYWKDYVAQRAARA